VQLKLATLRSGDSIKQLVKMKKELIEILACPLCKGELELNIEEENEREVVTGSLHCSKCEQCYSIEGTIPSLLPPELRR